MDYTTRANRGIRAVRLEGSEVAPGQVVYEELLKEVEGFWEQLPDMPEETPRVILRALWFAAAVQAKSAVAAGEGELPALEAEQVEKLKQMIALRRNGMPLAYLTGRQSFMGLELLTGPEAMIPRQETEILCAAAMEKIRQTMAKRGRARVVDLCTGCGNLPLAYAAHVAGCAVHAADLSQGAVGLAEQNAERLGLKGAVDFRRGDLFGPFDTPEFVGSVDVVTCNPPYISTARVPTMYAAIAEYEPRMAFDGGPFGVGVLMRLVEQAPRYLGSGGWVGFEVGVGQGAGMEKRMRRMGEYERVEVFKDAAGEVRAIFAQRR